MRTSLYPNRTPLNVFVKDTDVLANDVNAKRYDELKAQVDKQANIPAKQQRYLKILDRKERENNLIVTGVPNESESLEGGTSDEAK